MFKGKAAVPAIHGFGLFLLMLFAADASAQVQTAAFYHEAVVTSPGEVTGELNVVRPEGMDGSLIYTFRPDGGAFDLYQQSTGAKVLHGRVHADGQVQTAPPSAPKPPRRPGGGAFSLTCNIAELAGRLECQILCGSAGVKEVVGGVCGVGAKCFCNVPPPPPVDPQPVPGNGFIAPWLTINDFWGTGGRCGLSICDDRDEF